ncbi:TetR/AcrR family transcriptional regulator [uncultured Shewanella sp.]|uniref:TetR/AcrR family transcriptional regulator n=1 Tax=uncultured Shewanella sp. TaxID=173975 RepID=UPI002612CDD9|nr:TetR/AcrR family transcriptional regulator [uncultured Shewanella sp.]
MNKIKCIVGREEIAKYAVNIMDENGDLDFSFSDIRNRYRISAGKLYRCFPSKSELLAYIYYKTLSEFFDITKDFHRYQLTTKEKIACLACLQIFVRGIFPDRTGIDILSTNKFVFDNASDSILEDLNKLISNIQKFRFSQFVEAVNSGELIATEEEIKLVLKHLALISRGSLFISRHIFLSDKKSSIFELMDFCDVAMNQLEWSSANYSIDHNKVLLAMRTMIDRKGNSFIR